MIRPPLIAATIARNAALVACRRPTCDCLHLTDFIRRLASTIVDQVTSGTGVFIFLEDLQVSRNGLGHHPASVSERAASDSKELDLLCFSHLRWDFVYQRPQHLLSRAAKSRRVFFWEEPIAAEVDLPALVTFMREGVCVVRPQLPKAIFDDGRDQALRELLQGFLESQHVTEYVAWYYTPMALAFTSQLRPAATVYDCMDELSAFQGAPPKLKTREAELFRAADVIFTGGRSLYESKVNAHSNVKLFPSSIDKSHFEQALTHQPDPEDQRDIPHPRAGFFGVLDERLDRELLRDVAALRPDMQFILLGPVVKIRSEDLPTAHNLHYLGQKSYAELPGYIGGWEVAILPFARNEATAFISPTKTPEYLAAGRRVVSTPIRDVVRDYGDAGLVAIAATPREFAEALDRALEPETPEWKNAVDRKLASSSWDATWKSMSQDVGKALLHKKASLTVDA